MSETLKALGLEGEMDEHPADHEVLQMLGLKPESNEHPATKQTKLHMLGHRILEDWEVTPGAKPPKQPSPTKEERIESLRKIAPFQPAVSEAIKATRKTMGAGSELVSQGIEDTAAGKYIRGPGKVLGGALLTAVSPIAGATEGFITNPLTRLTGNPDFAEKAGLFVPLGGAGKVAKPIVKAVSPSNAATRAIAEIAGSENLPEMLTRLKDNPRLRLMDVSDPLRVSAQAMVDPAQSNAMTSIVRSVKTSTAGAKDAVRKAFDEAMGESPNIVEAYEKLQKTAQKVGREKIDPPLKSAKSVDVQPVIDEIDSILKPGVQAVTSPGTAITPTRLQQELVEWRTKLTDNKSILTDANRLHEVQSDLRRYAEELMKSQGPDKRIGRELMKFRDKLVDRIEEAAPGYKKGLEEYRDAMGVQKAFTDGQNTLQNSSGIKGIETRPEYLERWIKKASPEEVEARRLGARDAIEQKMGAFQYAARRGTDIPEIDFNRRKMEILFGKERTERMFKLLRDERDIALSNQRIMGNSKTAETLTAREMLKPRDISQPHSSLPGWALATGAGMGALSHSPELGALAGGVLLAGRAGKAGTQWLGQKHDMARNRILADLVSSTGMKRDDAVAQLVALIKKPRKGNKLNNLVVSP